MTRDEYLRLSAAAKVAGLPVNDLRARADRGEVPSSLVPGERWRYFRRSDMEALRQRIEANFTAVRNGRLEVA